MNNNSLPEAATASGSVGQIVSPPYQGATQVSLAMSLSEVTISFGTIRQIIDQTIGQPGAKVALDWFVSIGLPAPSARNLADALTLALAEYESRYGKIPADPSIKFATGIPELS